MDKYTKQVSCQTNMSHQLYNITRLKNNFIQEFKQIILNFYLNAVNSYCVMGMMNTSVNEGNE